MQIVICEKIQRVTKNRAKLQEKLNVKIDNRGKEVSITGKPEDEYIAEKVIEALEFGFPFSVALLIKEEDMLFESINIKDHTKRNDLKSVRGRIIGTDGKTLSTLHTLTKCYFELKDNQVGIIGDPEHMRNAQEAIILIVSGAKQANVYTLMEKQQPKPIFDLGLKPEKKKK